MEHSCRTRQIDQPRASSHLMSSSVKEILAASRNSKGGQAGGSSGNANITTNNDGETSDTGTITNINNNEPVRLNIGRRKRSFGFFDNNHFPTAGSFGPSGYGNMGPFHHPGASYGGFGQPKGYNHPESSGHVHPGDQNGNLFGGTATSYIKYPGETWNLQGGGA
ncbi:hypothetical protein RRG08_038665 [Elysia crispata]|uniref:Uncharacterized protein n=1 Tax=Elysia crispata TaxID=231223 RepID=A0AAE0ZJ95_9GAST|nr:hypothetical protein RRG08_038665 [Elysia crispata]